MKKPLEVGTRVKVTTDRKLLIEHGLEDRRDHPDSIFTIYEVAQHATRWVHLLDDKDDLWYPPEVLIKVKEEQ